MAKIKTKFHIDIDKVQQVYSGSPGCACGCRGNHRYPSKFRNDGKKIRGYEFSDEDISDISVKRMVNKFNKLDEFEAYYDKNDKLSFVCVENDTRINVIYFK